MWYFEAFEVGDECETIHRTISEYELGSFVGLTGFFEEFFISTPNAKEHPLAGQRFVPGQLTFIIAEGLYILTGRLVEGIALLGFDKVTLLHPVLCGDTVSARVTVESTRTTKDLGRGIVTTSHVVLNQAGKEVLTYESARMVRTQPKG